MPPCTPPLQVETHSIPKLQKVATYTRGAFWYELLSSLCVAGNYCAQVSKSLTLPLNVFEVGVTFAVKEGYPGVAEAL